MRITKANDIYMVSTDEVVINFTKILMNECSTLLFWGDVYVGIIKSGPDGEFARQWGEIHA